MKKVVAALVLSLIVAPAFAAQKPCAELKSEIAKKFEARGVKNVQLTIVATEEVKDQKVIGSCERGKKKIAYKKGREAPAAKASPTSQPTTDTAGKPPATSPAATK
jgi:hypothetical protein